MALDQEGVAAGEKKDLYEVGELPPVGHVPEQMYAWTIRRQRHGEPDKAFEIEVVDVPKPDSNEVLVMVMAAGVNYNGVWAGLGIPISPFDVHKADFHIAGSDASGIVYAVGDKVKRWKIGDEVVIHCNQDDGDDEHCNGGDPMYSPSQRIWGYETPDGSFAQFTCVQSQQLMPRPQHLTWEEAACYTLTLATLKPGQNVLVWGASGGLGSYAIQLINTAGANAIGVISDESKRDFVISLGAKGVLNRNDFNCWGQMPTVNTPEYKEWFNETRKFGKAIWDITGKGNNVDMVFEHPGEASHFANLKQASAANNLMVERRLDPCMSEVFSWADIPAAHTKMRKNEHKPGNMAVLVQSPKTGLRTLEDAQIESRP